MAARQSVTKRKGELLVNIACFLMLVHRTELDLPDHVGSPPFDAIKPEAAFGSRDPQPNVFPAPEESNVPAVEAQAEPLAEQWGFPPSVE